MIASAPADILRFVEARADEGIATVLVTLVGLEGSSSRTIGAQMAVAADGRSLGSFSGGCIESAVIAEALDALAENGGRIVRFGAGSRYIDIRLPCGGGMDLLFTPRPDRKAVSQVLDSLSARRPAALGLSLKDVQCPVLESACAGWQGDLFVRPYLPPLRVVAIGQGDDLVAFARLACSFGAEVAALSPDPRALDALAGEAIETWTLLSHSAPVAVAADPWTAIVFLFHDRDWEDALLPGIVGLPALYIGAVGSPGTHNARIDRLRSAGVAEPLLRRLRGPIGLIPATRDPATLALSILSEVVQDYHKLGPAQRIPAHAMAARQIG